MSFRLITQAKMDGRLSMAIDEALTEAVAEGASPQAVRLYGFAPPTLSLGRFQRVKDRLEAELLEADGVTLVRRPTGGHAVLHDDELTYSIVLLKEEAEKSLGSFRKRAIYGFIAGILIKGLARLGIEGMLNAEQRGDLRNPDCFGSAGEYEISTPKGLKLIGSAQMTTRKAVLQQGSIPISNPGGRIFRYIKSEGPLDERLPSSLSEEVGRRLSFDEARAAFKEAFREALGAEDSALDAPEERAAGRILAERYQTDAWNLMY